MKGSISMDSSNRLFLLGSGPSLKNMDLNLMVGEESWGMGRINKIYDRTYWRPTRVFWSDMVNPSDYPDLVVHLVSSYDLYCTGIVKRHLSGELQPGRYGGHNFVMPTPYNPLADRIHTYEYCMENGMYQKDRAFPFSWRDDEEPGVYCRYGGTLQVALMHAVEEGFNPIYVIGADLGYTSGAPGGTGNHFADDYQVGELSPYRAEAKNRAHATAHRLAREYAEERGINIYNASSGGNLEAYERVDFNSLF